RASIERNGRAQVAQGLDANERVWRRLIEQNAERLQQASTLLASDYGFRSAVNSGDADTIESVLYNHGARIGAAVTALLDTRMQLVVSSAADASADARAVLRGVLPALTEHPGGSQIAIVDGVPYQFVT
ncbi:cache domain-containing protein, partial [Raoultella sp. 18111]